MSISDKLAELETDITNAYNSISAKGGTLPSYKNTNNLDTAISSIPSGGNQKCKVAKYILLNDITTGGKYKLLENDSDLLTHRNDDNLTVIVKNIDIFQGISSVKVITNGNIGYGSNYGQIMYSSTSGVASSFITSSLSSDPSATNQLGIDDNGNLIFYMPSNRPLRAGTYIITISWED